jgi:hypothetical protein
VKQPPDEPGTPPRLPRRPSPFASLEAARREQLLGQTAEAWYYFADAQDVGDLLDRVGDDLRQGGARVADALVFAVLSADDTQLATDPEPPPSAS